MKSIISSFFMLLIMSTLASAALLPSFGDYPSGSVYSGPSARPVLTSPDARAFRTRIVEGAHGPANFAGHFHIITWGCGTSCEEGAIVDALTGHVTMLPFSVCCYVGPMNADFDGIEVKPSSSLVVFHGQRNEEGINGDHYYLFDGHVLSFLQSVEVKEAPEAATPAPTPDPAPAASSSPAMATLAKCVVADPTPTPLNYRTSPNGPVLGGLLNGYKVIVLDTTVDAGGKPWVYVANEDRTPLGWVFRSYVNCF